MEQYQEILNVAVFEYLQKGNRLHCQASAVTSKDDAIHTGLKALKEAERMGEAPIEVLAVYSEWKPSDELYQYLISTYPDLTFSYSYEDGDEEKFKEDLKRLL